MADAATGGGGDAPKLKVADRWPVIYNWAHGGTVLAPELIRECRDVLGYLGAQPEGAEPVEKGDVHGG